MNREYPDRPLVGVGALILKGDSVLLVKRKNEPGKGLWSIPGGLLELGETLESAAKREVKEETGIDIEINRLIGVNNLIRTGEESRVRFHYVLVDYLAHPVGGTLTHSPEIEDARWVKMSEVDGYPLTKTVKRLLRKAGFTITPRGEHRF